MLIEPGNSDEGVAMGSLHSSSQPSSHPAIRPFINLSIIIRARTSSGKLLSVRPCLRGPRN